MVARRKKRTVRSAGWPAFKNCVHCLQAHTGGLGFASRRQVGRAWCAYRLRRSGGVVEGNHISCEAVAERDEVLDIEEVYESFADRWRACLVKLVNVVRRNK